MTSLAVRHNYDPVMVDVREPAEYADMHLYGAINIPSTSFTVDDFEPFRGRPIFLICNTGVRVARVMETLREAGFEDVRANSVQMQAYSEQTADNPGIEGSWTVDRQFRLVLGILLLTSLLGVLISEPLLLGIAAIIATGLTVTALIDRCYFKMLIARMPWNVRT